MSKTKYGIIDLEKQTLDSINSNIMNNIDSLKHQNEEQIQKGIVAQKRETDQHGQTIKPGFTSP